MPRGESDFVEWARTLIGVVGCCGLPIGSVWSMRLSDLPIVPNIGGPCRTKLMWAHEDDRWSMRRLHLSFGKIDRLSRDSKVRNGL